MRDQRKHGGFFMQGEAITSTGAPGLPTTNYGEQAGPLKGRDCGLDDQSGGAPLRLKVVKFIAIHNTGKT